MSKKINLQLGDVIRIKSLYYEADYSTDIAKLSLATVIANDNEGYFILGWQSNHKYPETSWRLFINEYKFINKINNYEDYYTGLYYEYENVSIEKVQLSLFVPRSGCTCMRCNTFVSYSEPNQADGSFKCYECRQNRFR